MDSFSVTYVSPAEARVPRGWFVVLGLMLIVLGTLAAGHLLMATFVSIFVLGALMFIGALFQIVHAFAVRRWSAFGFWLLSGILYLLAGVGVFYDPLLAVRVLTLCVAVSLFLSGLLRLWIGVRDRELSGSGWIAVSGGLSLLASVAIALAWPADSAWVLGLFLACDLLFQGIAFLIVGFATPELETCRVGDGA